MLSGKSITINSIPVKFILPVLSGLIIIVGLLAGSYPAFYLSAFKPILVLKGKIATGFKSGRLRNFLVVFQFAIAIVLMVGTIVIYSQLHYIHNKKLGYNRNQVLILQNTYSLGDHAKTFKDEIAKLPGVMNVTMTKNLPTSTSNDITGFMTSPVLKASNALIMGYWHIDADYISTMGMTLLKGRNFSPSLQTDSYTVLINETAAKMFGFKDPVNKKIYVDGHGNPVELTIIGVLKDFNAGSLRNKIEPTVFNLAEERGSFAVRVNTQHLPALIAQIKAKYQALQIAGGPSFSYSFMDDDFNNLYKSEQQTGTLFMSFATLAIFIACLGLFGLITFAAEQRVKEIGIRKIMGASISNIVNLMSKDFLKLVLLAAVIAFPVAWWSMNKWLENFAFRTDISWWIFLTAGALALLIAVVTISVQAIKAAVVNPVKSLRTE
jgi:putative ABC transport system permease protein